MEFIFPSEIDIFMGHPILLCTALSLGGGYSAVIHLSVSPIC